MKLSSLYLSQLGYEQLEEVTCALYAVRDTLDQLATGVGTADAQRCILNWRGQVDSSAARACQEIAKRHKAGAALLKELQ